jgi:hypothetical protein
MKVNAVTADKAQIAGNTYCLLHYATGYSAGTPRRMTMPGKQWWVMPVLLTSPGYGVVGEVGVLAVDARTGKVVGSTSRQEVVAAGKRLAEEKRDDLEAAFRRARTV